MTNRLQDLQDALAVWTDQTFGPQPHGGSSAVHLAKETAEVQADPFDIVEWADCLLLILNGARRSGFDMTALLDAAEAKLAINRTRRWGKLDKDGVSEHIRDEETA